MLAKRVIPCLDVDAGRVVKGTEFQDLRDAGDPVELAARYDAEGADELVFLDITATVEGRKATLDVISQTAEQVFIPLTVGGGVRSDDDVNELLRAGADKVSLNSAAVREPALLQRCADRFGDPVHGRSRSTRSDEPRAKAGRCSWTRAGPATGRDAVEWAVEATTRAGCGRGAADVDGPRRHGQGYDLDLLRAVSGAVRVPLVASGGAGELEHFADAVVEGGADAVLAASTLPRRGARRSPRSRTRSPRGTCR